MFKTVINKLLMVLYFVVGALILEALTFHILDLGTMPEYFMYNLSLIFVVAIFVFVIPNFVAQYVVYTIILTLQMVLIYINYSLSQVYGDLLSIEMIRLIGEAGAAMTSSFVYISVILELILVYALIVTFGAFMLKYCKKDENTVKQHFSIFSIIIILSVQLFGVGLSIQIRDKVNAMTSITDEQYSLSDKFLMNTSILKTSSYTKFGTYGYFTNMIVNAIRNEGSAIEKATLEYFNSGNIYDGTFYDEKGNKKSNGVFGIDQGNNVIVIMMESLEWFAFGNGTYDKEFNNLSYELTPNVYSLIYGEDYLTDSANDNKNNDAIIAKNFFAKSKTNMSEGQGIIGNYPVAQALTDIVDHDSSAKQALGYAMPNVLRKMGYTTSYVHSHKISFYSRGETHSHLGFEHVVGKDSIRDKNGNRIYTGNELDFDNWDAEGNFVNNAIDHIVPTDRSKPFYTFYLNVSSHGAYTAKDNKHDGDALKYYDYVRYGEDDCTLNNDGNWKLNKSEADATKTEWYQNICDNYDDDLTEMMVYYQCGVKGLDDAISIIINKLKDYNIYEETTLLLYSDHYAYYDSLSHDIKNLDRNNNNNQELNTIPMIISSPGIKERNSQTDDKYIQNYRFASAYDVVPTLFDLLGIKFNENLYVGHSLFKPLDVVYTENDETKDMVVYYSNTGGLFGDGIYTFNMSTFVTPRDHSTETIDLFAAECTTLLIKINFLSFLNRYNLFYKLTNV